MIGLWSVWEEDNCPAIIEQNGIGIIHTVGNDSKWNYEKLLLYLVA